jgi:hypothetical protein
MAYLLLILAGALLCNALPHLISGLRGETFYTPWGRANVTGRSSALENFLWGAANLLVAVFLLDRKLAENIPHGLMAVTLGFLVAGAVLSLTFGRRVA